MSSSPATPAQQPTRARYWVIFFAVTLAILAYIDRVASPRPRRDLRDLGFSRSRWG
jgi:MFS transporter, ACS family, glucarate transporter